MSDIVEFRHLKYIVAIAETANFTRAAERLFLSQPSLSRQIKDLEEEIGFPIFQRTREGVRITPVGQMVVDYAISALSGRLQILNIAKEVYLGKIPSLRVGFSSFVNSRHLQSFRSNYDKLFPQCGMSMAGGYTAQILQRLERNELDCAVLPLPIIGTEWIVNQFSSSCLVACMRSDDSLAINNTVSLEELVPRLTIFRDPEGHPSAHARLKEMFAEEGYSIHILSSAITPHDIQLLVRDGYGIALVCEDTQIDSQLTTRRISGVTWTCDTAFVYSVNARHPALPFIAQTLLNRPEQHRRKGKSATRPQLPLKFDQTG
jgi:DNA-binding transcriptional LysR family regulator